MWRIRTVWFGQQSRDARTCVRNIRVTLVAAAVAALGDCSSNRLTLRETAAHTKAVV